MSQFQPIALPYDYSDLAPAIDALTVETHYEKHHKGYAAKLNTALESVVDFKVDSIEALLSDLDSVPSEIRGAVRNNGGGFYNHNVYWQVMTPGGGELADGDLKAKIDESFGSVEDLKSEFLTAAATLFGSGWAWLVDHGDKLMVVQTHNQDNPLMTSDAKILLGVDVWEHAYYLNYKNLRPDYLEAFWSIINWSEVENRLK